MEPMMGVLPNCKYIDSEAGSFDKGKETIKYQKANFKQPNGKQVNLPIDNSVPLSEFVEDERYDLTINVNNKEQAKDDRIIRSMGVRVIDAKKSQVPQK